MGTTNCCLVFDKRTPTCTHTQMRTPTHPHAHAPIQDVLEKDKGLTKGRDVSHHVLLKVHNFSPKRLKLTLQTMVRPGLCERSINCPCTRTHTRTHTHARTRTHTPLGCGSGLALLRADAPECQPGLASAQTRPVLHGEDNKRGVSTVSGKGGSKKTGTAADLELAL